MSRNPFKTNFQVWLDGVNVGAWLFWLGLIGGGAWLVCAMVARDELQRDECLARQCTPPNVPVYDHPYKSASRCICAEVPR